MPDHLPVTLHDIYLARRRIAGQVTRTPLIRSHMLSTRFAAEVYLKLETLQPTGAFKLRGATNKIAALTPEQLERGVTTASTGNHGRAVAYAASRSGVRAIICMSALVPHNKVEAIEALGAETRIIGHSQDEAFVEARRLVAQEGMTLIEPFDDPLIVAGQGTIGLELLEDLPELDHVLIGLSGGGLLGGIGRAVKVINPAVHVTGVSMQEGAAMRMSLEAGQPVEVEEVTTFADSLGGGIGLDNRCTFTLVREVMDDSYAVSEAAIARAMVHFFAHEKMVVEGAAAVGLAALEEHCLDIRGRTVALIVSGNGVSSETFMDAWRVAHTASH
ncbi:hydroxyectoine utilization dehydratase EutB [Phytohalomonas tamaricis]|uniref:hydroxyectoine utilization dehydratase EutB n=1 Tax=Phytohalomonas tamaricis TaxID=2081032 RepID=UPI000D0BA052|nr:hydroxyectoine utilization dehydratase EutB [Phytohalomonas tamaricis]